MGRWWLVGMCVWVCGVGGFVAGGVRADQDVNDDVELFSVPLAGGGVTQLNGPLVAGGDVSLGCGVAGFVAGGVSG